MNRTVKWTFEFKGVFDDALNIPLTTPKELKGVEISTLTNTYGSAEQSAMSQTHSLILEFDPDFKMDDTKKIDISLKAVDATWGLKSPGD